MTTMTIDQAVEFAFNIVKEVKEKMILSGLGGKPEEVFAACKGIANRLRMDISTVIEIFEVV